MKSDGDFFKEKAVLERGDLVLFSMPDGSNRVYRLIGLPGDTIQFVDGTAILNGEPIKQKLLRRIRVKQSKSLSGTVEYIEYEESLPNGKEWRIYDMVGRASAENTPLFQVPKDHVFVVGDNRDNANDSRMPEGHPDLLNSVDPNAEDFCSLVEVTEDWPASAFCKNSTLAVRPNSHAAGFVPIENLMGKANRIYATLFRCKPEPGLTCPNQDRSWKLN